MITVLGKKELVTLFVVCGKCIAYYGLFALPLGAINRLCSVVVALLEQLLYYISSHLLDLIIILLPPKALDSIVGIIFVLFSSEKYKQFQCKPFFSQSFQTNSCLRIFL